MTEEKLNCGRSAEVKQAEVRMHTVSRPDDRRPLSKPYRLHAHIQHTPSVLTSSPTLSSLPHFARTPQTEERALEEWVAASPQRWLSILIVPTPLTLSLIRPTGSKKGGTYLPVSALCPGCRHGFFCLFCFVLFGFLHGLWFFGCVV